MTFKIKNLTVKNFMSVGNATQAINFDRNDLTLVLGENLDLGGDDSGARNGTGKTTIINALSYAFYGLALTNIKRDNLINKTNGKSMLVTVDFEHNGINYRIERGRKPAVTTFYVGGVAQEAKDNDAHGDSRETQGMIERVLGMSHDMFRHVVALNTYTEPFLSLKNNDQRAIIEQLLGITMLSEKADALKEAGKVTRDLITSEEHRCKAVAEANKRITEQIDALKRRDKMWLTKKNEDIAKFTTAISELGGIDIDAEIVAHNTVAVYNAAKKDLDDLNKALLRVSADIAREEKGVSKLTGEIQSLSEHKCHSCGQELHDAKHEEILAAKTATLAEHVSELEVLAQQKEALQTAIAGISLGTKPTTYYATLDEAYNHRTTLDQLQIQLAAKQTEESPYTEQISDMETTAIVEFDYSTINDAMRMKEHQEFLYKLLTNKDSFIRKQIIDQNLSYLNARLSHYLDRIGLPHTVVFQNDLSVNIEELGRELDFDNLSRGERNRLILSMSWAFRDVWESLYQPINLLFIDEMIDSGMDTSGVENALAILKKMSRDANKSIWLVSHKDELISRVTQVLKVIKENGYTVYSNDLEVN